MESTTMRSMLLKRIALSSLALFFITIGIALIAGGAKLLLLGGSPYYVLAGVALAATAWLLIVRRALAAVLFGTFILLTEAWALWEVGLDGWALMPRLAGPGILLAAIALVMPLLERKHGWEKRLGWLAIAFAGGVLAAIGIAGVATSSFHPAAALGLREPAGDGPDSIDWPSYAGTQAGPHFSPAGQITPDNVGGLIPAWTFHTGDMQGPRENGGFEATPVKVGDRLYFCTAHSSVIALDPGSGKQLWRYDARPGLNTDSFANCRGVTHYHATRQADGRCAERIAIGTLDFRLISLDALDGHLCADFGTDGIVKLDKGFPRLPVGAVTMSSPPAFIDGLLVVGHFVMDNQRTDAPPGVVRAYDAGTGGFRWAWDMGRPDRSSEPPEGETYSLGRPNAWAGFAPDPSTGLVFVPLGNPGSDYFGARRTADMQKYGSSLVALEAATGKPRWHFQTVHHDIWDYDIPSPPALFDFPTPNGKVPALAQATKTGQIYILRRSDGTPLVPVTERPVSTDGAPGETPAPTQPFSAMPDLGGPDLSERDTWGLTPIDQMLCRISFRQSHYEGRFTPLQLRPTLYSPGYSGGMNWGGVAIDPLRGLLLVNSLQVANRAHLIARPDPGSAQGDPGHDRPEFFPFPQKGTPYSVSSTAWLSPLSVPCQRPPWGLITAIDLMTRSIRWQRPLGDASQSGPWGLRSHLSLTIGTPNQGGALATGGGLLFIGASVDAKLRAFDSATGELLWHYRLPGGGHATPMSYVHEGTQYVVIAAGGHTVLQSPLSDTLVAFRLPQDGPGPKR